MHSRAPINRSCYAQAPSTTLSYLPLTLHLRFLQPFLQDLDLCAFAVESFADFQPQTPEDEVWIQFVQSSFK